MPAYSEKVMDHFMNPRNVGEIEDASGIGEEGNPVCGDMMTFYIKVDENERLTDVKFKTFGCGAAIAVSSMVSEMAKGMTVEEAKKITPASVAAELGGLPKKKMHCSNLGAQALNQAIADYESRKRGDGPLVRTPGETHDHHHDEEEEKVACSCPSCDLEFEGDESNICKPCSVSIQTCPDCKKIVTDRVTKCPDCGAKLI